MDESSDSSLERSKDADADPGSLVDKHGFDNVMRGLLAVKPKTEKKDITSKKQRNVRTD